MSTIEKVVWSESSITLILKETIQNNWNSGHISHKGRKESDRSGALHQQIYNILVPSCKAFRHIIKNVLSRMAEHATVKRGFASEMLRNTGKDIREERKSETMLSLCKTVTHWSMLGRMTV